jgi:hypothetical protein
MLHCREYCICVVPSSTLVISVFGKHLSVHSELSSPLWILAENSSDALKKIDAGAVYEIAYKVQQRNAAEAQDVKQNIESQNIVEQR